MNALVELESEVRDRKILAAKIYFQYNVFAPEDEYVLYPDYLNQEYEDFLKFMDRDYDNGWGSQILFGTIWFGDSWLERSTYDGSEWWTEKSYPKLPRRSIE